MKELDESFNSIISMPFVQMIFNVILSGGLFYWIQRKHKRNDEFIIEKNKRLVEKHIDCESQLFEMMNTVKTNSINGQISNVLSDKINTFKILNYLYISEPLLKISKDFSDYLLEISVDQNLKNIKTEDKLIKKFKTEFKK